MTTLVEIETAVINLSQVDFQRLVAWMTPLTQSRLRVMVPQTAHRVEPYPVTFEEYLELEANSRIRHEYLSRSYESLRVG